jgi:predicted dehydrogenase
MTLIDQLRLRNLVQVVVACDVLEDRCRVVKERFGIPRFTTDYRHVVEIDDVDLVLVVTSMLGHAEITRAALLAGRHVLVGKPVTTTLDEAAEIVALADDSLGYFVRST